MAGHWGRRIADRMADISADLESHTRLLVGLGLVLTTLTAATVVAVFASFGGAFATYAAVTAVLPATSTAVPPGSGVEYRDVTVGKVAGEGHRGAGGLVAIPLHLDPSKLASIPAGVTAQVEPVSIFGNQYVVLTAPPGPAPAAALRAGATIGPHPVVRTNSVQQTVGDLDHLLLTLQPARLDLALTAVAQALQGQGHRLGVTLDSASSYLGKMQPLWPTVVADLGLADPVAASLSTSAPDLIGTVANSATASHALTDDPGALTGLLGAGTSLATTGTQVLTAIQQPFSVLLAAASPLLADISANPQEVAQLLSGLDGFAKALVSAESAGPYLSATATVQVVNPANLALGALAGPDMLRQLAAALPAGIVDPPTYTGPASTLTAASAQAVAATQAVAGRPTVGVLPEPAAADAAAQVAAAVTGQTPDATAAGLLAGPLLAGLARS